MSAPKYERSQVADIGSIVTWQQIAETLVQLDVKSCVGEPLEETTDALAELLGIMSFNKLSEVEWSQLNDVQRAALRHFHESSLTSQLLL